MSETQQEAPAQQSANGVAAGVPDAAPPAVVQLEGAERVMYAIMLLAGVGLLFLGIDGLTGYALSGALFSRGDGDG